MAQAALADALCAAQADARAATEAANQAERDDALLAAREAERDVKRTRPIVVVLREMQSDALDLYAAVASWVEADADATPESLAKRFTNSLDTVASSVCLPRAYRFIQVSGSELESRHIDLVAWLLRTFALYAVNAPVLNRLFDGDSLGDVASRLPWHARAAVSASLGCDDLAHLIVTDTNVEALSPHTVAFPVVKSVNVDFGLRALASELSVGFNLGDVPEDPHSEEYDRWLRDFRAALLLTNADANPDHRFVIADREVDAAMLIAVRETLGQLPIVTGGHTHPADDLLNLIERLLVDLNATRQSASAETHDDTPAETPTEQNAMTTPPAAPTINATGNVFINTQAETVTANSTHNTAVSLSDAEKAHLLNAVNSLDTFIGAQAADVAHATELANLNAAAGALAAAYESEGAGQAQASEKQSAVQRFVLAMGDLKTVSDGAGVLADTAKVLLPVATGIAGLFGVGGA
ncbi:MAG: hypothetical protein AAGA11_00985 [Pseudomonadota bacterium]